MISKPWGWERGYGKDTYARQFQQRKELSTAEHQAKVAELQRRARQAQFAPSGTDEGGWNPADPQGSTMRSLERIFGGTGGGGGSYGASGSSGSGGPMMAGVYAEAQRRAQQTGEQAQNRAQAAGLSPEASIRAGTEAEMPIHGYAQSLAPDMWYRQAQLQNQRMGMMPQWMQMMQSAFPPGGANTAANSPISTANAWGGTWNPGTPLSSVGALNPLYQ